MRRSLAPSKRPLVNPLKRPAPVHDQQPTNLAQRPALCPSRVAKTMVASEVSSGSAEVSLKTPQNSCAAAKTQNYAASATLPLSEKLPSAELKPLPMALLKAAVSARPQAKIHMSDSPKNGSLEPPAAAQQKNPGSNCISHKALMKECVPAKKDPRSETKEHSENNFQVSASDLICPTICSECRELAPHECEGLQYCRRGNLEMLQKLAGDDGEMPQEATAWLLTAVAYSKVKLVQFLLGAYKKLDPLAVGSIKIEMQVSLDPNQATNTSALQIANALLVMNPGSRNLRKILQELRLAECHGNVSTN